MSSPIPSGDPGFPSRWVDLATSLCNRIYAEAPADAPQPNERARAYCVHDNAYLIAWLVDELDLGLTGSFERNVRWLAGLLEARDFDMTMFWRNIDNVAEAVTEIRPAMAAEIAVLVAAPRRPL